MPGLCGVINIVRQADAPKEPASVMLDRMCAALCHSSSDTVLHRLAFGPFQIAAVGYPSTVWRPFLAEDTEGASELWFGEVHEGRPTSPPALPGAPGRFLDSAGMKVPLARRLANLSGNLVGIRLNPRTREFDLFNDALGTIPLHVRRVGGRLLFAPEIKALLELSEGGIRGDGRALAFYLGMGHLPPGRTHFQEIRSLSPASILSGRADEPSWCPPVSRRYWDYGFADSLEDRGTAHYLSAFEVCLKETVGSQAHRGERIGICLSGGHDSRGVLAAISCERAQLQSVTWGWNPGAEGCDGQVARLVAERAGIAHRFISLDPEALPRNASDWVWMTDGGIECLYNYPQGLDVFRELAAEFDVLLRGDNSYPRWPYDVPSDRMAQAAIGAYPYAWHSIYDRLVRPGAHEQLSEAGRAIHNELSMRLRSRHPLDRKDEYFYEVHLFAKMNALNYLKSLALPIRNPLIDRRSFELLQRVPRRLRHGKRLFKTVVATRFPEFASLPFARCTNLIPWRQVSARSALIARFLRSSLLDARGAFSDLIDRAGLEVEITEWLRQTRATPPDSAAPRKSAARIKHLWIDRAKRFVYHPWTPGVVRDAIVPPRSRKAAASGYLFRLLVLALYLEHLERRGIRLSWDWESGDLPWVESPRSR